MRLLRSSTSRLDTRATTPRMQRLALLASLSLTACAPLPQICQEAQTHTTPGTVYGRGVTLTGPLTCIDEQARSVVCYESPTLDGPSLVFSVLPGTHLAELRAGQSIALDRIAVTDPRAPIQGGIPSGASIRVTAAVNAAPGVSRELVVTGFACDTTATGVEALQANSLVIRTAPGQ